MDDDSSYVEMIDRYPGPDPAALFLAPILVSNPPPARPFASTQAPATPYVLHTACLHQSFAASFSAPQNNIMLFDKATLAATRTMSGHTDAVTSLKSVEILAGTNRRGLISCGKDGRIRIWDERSGSAGAFTAASGQSRPLSSFAVSPDGWTIAAGAELGVDPTAPVPSEAEMDAPIIFWDVRNPTTPKWTHTSTHSDDVTQLDFHPTLGSGAPGGMLLSASADGLLALTSVDQPEEDEAVQFVGNWNTSIAQVGWTVRPEEITGADPMNFKVWAASDMQTLSVWSDELALEHDYGDLRRTKIPQTWESDYLIDAQWFGYTHTMPWETNALGLWCGNNKGDIGLVSVQDTLSWRLDRVLSGGHTGIVRACTWDPVSHVLITGGEDSRLNLWSTSNGSSANTPTQATILKVASNHALQAGQAQ
ncbi:hypothetical protein FRC09_002897 [Ceratobasidium sp. 395]|nr:hypothetical protein FRC09_002897 [Ceratobasidium sp. 395]